MGLDWMLKSRDAMTMKIAPTIDVHEEVAAEEVYCSSTNSLLPSARGKWHFVDLGVEKF